MSDGRSKVEVEVTTGMMIDIPRYNKLVDIEKAEAAIPGGVSIILVHYKHTIGMIVPPDTQLVDICRAFIHIIGEPGKKYRMEGVRTAEGVLLSLADRVDIAVYQWQSHPWARLFPDIREEL